MKKITLFAICLFCLSLGACETIEGAGRDIGKAGDAIERAASR